MLNRKCRVCESSKLKKVVNFGEVPLGNNLQKSKLEAIKAKTYRLDLLNCSICNHIQLSNKVDKKILYKSNYTYLSSTGKDFLIHLKKYTDNISKIIKLKKNSLIIDIGSNDGSCLNYFKMKGHKVLGVDPAKIPSQIANKNGIETLESFFNYKISKKIVNKYGYADFITSHNVLAHVENLEEIFKNIFNTLKKNGYFCFEVGYFIKVIEKQLFDTVYHEHIDYHKASSISYLLKKVGFSIIKISQNKIQGGSLRILCKKKEKVSILQQPKNFIDREINLLKKKDYNLIHWNTFINKKMKLLLKNFNLFAKESSPKIIGYGAPTKSTLMIKISDIDHKKIDYIVEDNNQKIGRFIPKYGIPIKKVSHKNIKSAKLIFIFAWNFQKDIVHKLKHDFRYKGHILIPLPHVKLIKL